MIYEVGEQLWVFTKATQASSGVQHGTGGHVDGWYPAVVVDPLRVPWPDDYVSPAFPSSALSPSIPPSAPASQNAERASAIQMYSPSPLTHTVCVKFYGTREVMWVCPDDASTVEPMEYTSPRCFGLAGLSSTSHVDHRRGMRHEVALAYKAITKGKARLPNGTINHHLTRRADTPPQNQEYLSSADDRRKANSYLAALDEPTRAAVLAALQEDGQDTTFMSHSRKSTKVTRSSMNLAMEAPVPTKNTLQQCDDRRAQRMQSIQEEIPTAISHPSSTANSEHDVQCNRSMIEYLRSLIPAHEAPTEDDGNTNDSDGSRAQLLDALREISHGATVTGTSSLYQMCRRDALIRPWLHVVSTSIVEQDDEAPRPSDEADGNDASAVEPTNTDIDIPSSVTPIAITEHTSKINSMPFVVTKPYPIPSWLRCDGEDADDALRRLFQRLRISPVYRPANCSTIDNAVQCFRVEDRATAVSLSVRIPSTVKADSRVSWIILPSPTRSCASTDQGQDSAATSVTDTYSNFQPSSWMEPLWIEKEHASGESQASKHKVVCQMLLSALQDNGSKRGTKTHAALLGTPIPVPTSWNIPYSRTSQWAAGRAALVVDVTPLVEQAIAALSTNQTYSDTFPFHLGVYFGNRHMWDDDLDMWSGELLFVRAHRIPIESCSDNQSSGIPNISLVSEVLDSTTHELENSSTVGQMRTPQHEADDDDEIFEDKVEVSLQCPVTLLPMKYPARGLHCRHQQCFDLAPFLHACHRRNLWVCPLCSQPTLFHELRLDITLRDFLQRNDTPSNSTGSIIYEVMSRKYSPASSLLSSSSMTGSSLSATCLKRSREEVTEKNPRHYFIEQIEIDE